MTFTDYLTRYLVKKESKYDSNCLFRKKVSTTVVLEFCQRKMYKVQSKMFSFYKLKTYDWKINLNLFLDSYVITYIMFFTFQKWPHY